MMEERGEPFLLPLPCGMRSSACDTLSRSCARRVLCWLAFPSASAWLNNKIRVIQRRAYGLRNEEYLRLKVLTCMLPVL